MQVGLYGSIQSAHWMAVVELQWGTVRVTCEKGCGDSHQAGPLPSVASPPPPQVWGMVLSRDEQSAASCVFQRSFVIHRACRWLRGKSCAEGGPAGRRARPSERKSQPVTRCRKGKGKLSLPFGVGFGAPLTVAGYMVRGLGLSWGRCVC